MPQLTDFAVLGNYSIDIIVSNIAFPLKFCDVKPVQGVYFKPGGSARNVAVQLKLSGASVLLLAPICRSDPLFSILKKDLLHHNLSGSGLVSLGPGLSKTVILLSGEGQRMILANSVFPQLLKSQMQKILNLKIDRWRRGIENADVLVTKAFSFCKPWMELAHRLGKEIVCDFSVMNIRQEYFFQILKYCNIVMLSGTRRNGLKEDLKICAKARVPLVLVTHGERGVMSYSLDRKAKYSECKHPLPAENRVIVRDTTGAGDSFLGGFLGAYYQDKGLVDSVHIGQETAGKKIQEFGG
ncbi:carbohydrate kinase family protein [Candidatus Riflebacteria bacterium]